MKLGTRSPDPRGIAVIAPYDFALDHELWRWTPPGVTLYLTRTPYRALAVTVDMAGRVGDPAMVRRVARSVMTPGPEVAVYACTAGSFVRGRRGEADLRAALRRAGAPAAVTSAGALLTALDALRIRRVAVAAPYTAEVTAGLHAFLAEGGVRTVASSHLGLRGEIWKTPQRTVAELVRRADHPHAEAVVVSCTNLPSYDVVADLERVLGKPVLSANRVTMWAAVRALGAATRDDVRQPRALTGLPA